MKDSNKSAFPIFSNDCITEYGLTKREYFYGQALAGICANSTFMEQDDKNVAKIVVNVVNALMERIEKVSNE